MLMLINLAFFKVLTPYVCWYYLETHNRRTRDINHPILVVASCYWSLVQRLVESPRTANVIR